MFFFYFQGFFLRIILNDLSPQALVALKPSEFELLSLNSEITIPHKYLKICSPIASGLSQSTQSSVPSVDSKKLVENNSVEFSSHKIISNEEELSIGKL